MAIDVGRSLTSAGVGVVDELLERMDAKAGRVEAFRTGRDIGRIVGAGLGYGLQVLMPKHSRLGETIALSFTPLLVKAIAQPVLGPVTPATAPAAAANMERVFTPRRQVSQLGSGPTSSPQPTGSYFPAFEQVIGW